MLIDSIDKLAFDLEKEELESQGPVPGKLYEKLLAVYLYQNDLHNAKYLWKRIPANLKSSTELPQIWSVGECLWKRDLSTTYKILNSITWSDNVAPIMKLLKENIQNQAIKIISQAYSSIGLEKVAMMTGLSNDQVVKMCAEKHWSIETDINMIYPALPANKQYHHISNEDQLQKLTDFVSYLEN